MADLFTSDLLLFILIGFGAQLIDGALGLAFGLLTTSSLLAMGVPPATASAMTHITECFTTAASGASHAYHRNVDWRLVARLAPAGMVGGIVGAYVLSNVDGDAITPYVSAYLIAIGLYVIWKGIRNRQGRTMNDRAVPAVAVTGGFLDAVGGGGWGPMVTSTLLGRGHEVKKVIGSTNLTEFAVTLVISATFIMTLGLAELKSAVGLIIGGVIAAPIGAVLLKHIPSRPLMVAVGVILVGTAAVRFF